MRRAPRESVDVRSGNPCSYRPFSTTPTRKLRFAMAGYKLGSVASTIDGHGFHILSADNSLVVHFNFKTDEKAKITHERLAGMIGDVQSMTVYTPDPHPR
jgi:hypothetical protein